MPAQHTRPNFTGNIPDVAGQFNPNWMKLSRQRLVDDPAITTFSAALTLTAGAPGANLAFTFQPTTSPIFDRYNIVGTTATQNLRIPWDGIYDIYGIVLLNPTTQIWEFATLLQSAPTSDSGFGAPVFANYNNPAGFGYRCYFQNNLAAPTIVPRVTFVHTGLEFHANDLIRYMGQIDAAANQTAQLEAFTLRWVSPIPNNLQQSHG